jgi:hypothetical protein
VDLVSGGGRMDDNKDNCWGKEKDEWLAKDHITITQLM